MADPSEISVERTRTGAARIVVRGDLDMATMPGLATALEGALANPGGVLVDLAEVTFMDLRSVRLLLRAAEQARREQRSLEIVPPRGAAAMILEVTAAEAALPLVDEPPPADAPS